MLCNVNGTVGLLEILTWARPHDSECERRFCREFLDRIAGMQRDAFGNRYIRIGTAPVLWSCHVDTVSAIQGPQGVIVDTFGLARLKHQKAGRSLGADDGAGIWIMLNMIEARRPGLYVFHRGEEVGCLGSSFIRRNTPELLEGIQMAIAFDRAHKGDVITHQVSGRTCSDAFAESMSSALNGLEASFRYKPDDTGVYTDTNEYARLVPECTNLSVGYEGQHGPRETLDVEHCTRLLSAMLVLDTDTLVVSRDPAVQEDDRWGWLDDWRKPRRADPGALLALVKDNPETAAKLLEEAGITADEFEWAVWTEMRDYSPLAAA